MIVILGLVVLVVAVAMALAGVSANTGSGHALNQTFSMFGVHLSGLSTGQLFLLGIGVGAAGMVGLAMLSGSFTRRLASRGSRRELALARRDNSVLIRDREHLSDQLDAERHSAATDGVASDTNASDTVVPDTVVPDGVVPDGVAATAGAGHVRPSSSEPGGTTGVRQRISHPARH